MKFSFQFPVYMAGVIGCEAEMEAEFSGPVDNPKVDALYVHELAHNGARQEIPRSHPLFAEAVGYVTNNPQERERLFDAWHDYVFEHGPVSGGVHEHSTQWGRP